MTEAASLDIGVASPDALEVARLAREQASSAILAARTALAETRDRYLRDPSPELDAEVERAAAAVRSAERLADAREFQFRSVAELLETADRARASEALDRASAIRQQIRDQLGEQFQLLSEQLDAANQTIAVLMDLVRRDGHACKHANDAASKAGVCGAAVPVALDSVRAAFAILLSAGRRAPKAKIRLDDASRLRALILMLSRPDIQIDEQVEVLRVASLEIAKFVDDPQDISAWAAPLYSLSSIFHGTPEDLDYSRARRLLQAIQTTGLDT